MFKDDNVSHQIEQIYHYKDQINSGLFQIYKIITTQFPDIDTTDSINMQNLFSHHVQHLLDQLNSKR